MNAGQLAYDNIDRFGEYISLQFEGHGFTNISRVRNAQKLATVLKENGVKPGDRVMMVMKNCPEATFAFQATWILGAVLLPVMPQLLATELRTIIKHAEPKVIFTSGPLSGKVVEAAEGIHPVENILITGPDSDHQGWNILPDLESAPPLETLYNSRPDDLALLVYTASTTAKPRGVMLTHDNLISNAMSSQHELKSPAKTISLNVLPLAHVYGVLIMNLGYLEGGVSILRRQFSAKSTFEDVERYRVQRINVVPTMLAYLLGYPGPEKYDLSSLEHVISGGSKLTEQLRRNFEKKFGCTVSEAWGQTEATTVITGYPKGERFRPGSVGPPAQGVEISVRDENNQRLPPGITGEFCVKGRLVMKGYWKDEEATREAIKDGWLHTGDLGHLDEDGFAYITGRKKDLIIKCGENISCLEVENVIRKHPSVLEATVLGIPDAVWGETVCAVVILKPGTHETENGIKNHARKYINKIKVPDRVIFLANWPVSSKEELKKEILSSL